MYNDYALIIGVEDYRAYDRSGASNVPGAIGDVRTLVRQCVVMGFSPARIRVLSSPKLTPEDLGAHLPEENVGEATCHAINAGVEWLIRSLSGDASAAGLVTFSGHGLLDHGLVLCPSDFTGAPAHLIRVAEVRARLGQGRVADNLTVLLDCCHAQGGDAPATTVPARLANLARELDAGSDVVHERVLAACKTDQVSVSGVFGGLKMGAFTWAITSVLGQWTTRPEAGVARLTLSYGEAQSRIAGLLAALSFEQEPVLLGPDGVASLPFLHPGLDAAKDETCAAPDRLQLSRQIIPNEYQFELVYDAGGGSTTVSLADVIATGASPPRGVEINGSAALPDREYWFVNELALAYLASAQSIIVSAAPLAAKNYTSPYPAPTTQTISNLEYPRSGWTNGLGASTVPTSYGFYLPASGYYLQLCVQPHGSAFVIGVIGWWNTVDAYLNPAGMLTPTATLPQPGDMTYWGIVQTTIG